MVNMNDEYWRDPGCAAHVLKTFLLELPMPLFHTSLYNQVIDLIGEYLRFELKILNS